MEKIEQSLGRDYLQTLKEDRKARAALGFHQEQVELQPNDFLIMEPHELNPWIEDEKLKEHISMTKGSEPRNKLKGMMVKILEIKGDTLRVSVDGKETEIPKIFFQKHAEARING